MSALDELMNKDFSELTAIEKVITFTSTYKSGLDVSEQAAADLAALNARVEELETSNREWLESYDITMPCGHKNRYLLTNGRGELVREENGDCVCVMCQLELSDKIEEILKGAE